jgi:hypothetical protein
VRGAAAHGAGTNQFGALLAPHSARARVHPRRAGKVIVYRPTHNGGVSVAGKRDGSALARGADGAGANQFEALLGSIGLYACSTPYSLDLDWNVILQAGQSGTVDMFLNFPVMDMNRNAIWRNPDKAPAGGVDRMNKFWGDDSWRNSAYAEARQGNFFGPELVKQGNEQIVTAFQNRLKKVADFGFVPKPLPMRNSKKAVVYYLFFASPKAVAEKIITDIFRSYEARA